MVVQTCVGCGYGQYEASVGVCRSCPAGLVQLGTQFASSAAACVPCPSPGVQLAAADGTACLNVSAGYYVAAGRSTACPAGTYRADGMPAPCAPCEPGTWSAAGQAACRPCAPGMVAPSRGAVLCLYCPAGAIAPQYGTSACSACPPGTIPDQGATECKSCPANTRWVDAGTGCQPCDLGTVAPPGAVACHGCPPHTVPQLGMCGLCPPGYRMLSAVLNDGSSLYYSCDRCPDGTFNGAPTNSPDACAACGSTAYLSNGTACVPCPLGRASADGRTCVACAPGSASPQGLGCGGCAAGTYVATSGASACRQCAAGTYASAPGALACAACSPGTYYGGGGTACATCPQGTFASASGATNCTARRAACAVGQYVVSREGQPAVDNGCADCAPCAPGQFMVSVLVSTWNVLDGGGVATAALCPGTSAPTYRCLNNTWDAGFYLVPTMLAGLAPGGDLVAQRGLPCTDLANAPAVAAQRMQYVIGPTYECYVACMFSIDLAVAAQLQSRTNLFLARTAVFYADKLCGASSTAPCAIAGRYRPSPAPPCLLTPCVEPDGVTPNDGCIGACHPPPAHAVFIGGSSGNASGCPWACVGGADGAGYHLSDDGTACLACNDPAQCPAGYVLEPWWLCQPYSRTREVCKPCPPIPGGRAYAWSAGNASCLYECDPGYYPGGPALCLPCTFLNNVTCHAGAFRDVARCQRDGVEPPCSPCTGPADIVNAFTVRVTFTGPSPTPGVDACPAVCNAGYHTVLRSSPNAFVDTPQTVWNLTCTLCLPTDTVTCHGVCPANHFRDRAVASDTTPGACKTCTTNADCPVGYYAPLCTGNGTGDVACRPCDPALLAGGTRQFVPYLAATSLPRLLGLIRASAQDGFACPTACVPNSVLLLDPTGTTTCVPCTRYIHDLMHCDAEQRPMAEYPPLQPRPCDFLYAHWNATPGPIWWDHPRYTPSFLANALRFDSGGVYMRAGLCWACPTGLGVVAGVSTDLCQLLPGFTLRDEALLATERAPIPVDGKDLLLALTEPQPPPPTNFLVPTDGELVNSAFLQQARRRRRVLLQASSSSSNAEVAIPCPNGTYGDDRGRCLQCPAGTSTIARGSTSLQHCLCLPGYVRTGASCAPCPPDTFDARYQWSTSVNECTPCPSYLETTYGVSGATACACRAGYMRQPSAGGGNATTSVPGRVCVPCPENFFCPPCYRNQAGCVGGQTWVVPCMPHGVSPPGSVSLLNCTCATGQPRLLLAPSLEQLASMTSNQGLSCVDPPPNSVYDPARLTLACKTGWNPLYHPIHAQQLIGCALCPLGAFAQCDPAVCGAPARCVPCPLGTYANRTDLIGGCTPCDGALTTEVAGATSAKQCTCPAGTGRNAATGECEGCALRQYHGPGGVCVPCPDPHMMTLGVGALSVADCLCAPGYELNVNGTCVPCRVGTFSATASRGCTPCAVDKTTAGVGSTRAAQCVCDAARHFRAGSAGLCVDTTHEVLQQLPAAA